MSQQGTPRRELDPSALPPGQGPVIVFATRNRGKLAELEALARPLGLRVVGAAAFPGIPEVEEDGDSFEQNALKKARVIAEETGLPTLADDSGLVVDALGGAPGIHSARFAGAGATDAANNALLLQRLAGTPPVERGAHFECALAFVDPCAAEGTAEHVTRGRCDGQILGAPRGDGGFGYDPLFWVPELEATFAELDQASKNRLSHRARALAAMGPVLLRHFRSDQA